MPKYSKQEIKEALRFKEEFGLKVNPFLFLISKEYRLVRTMAIKVLCED